MFTVIESCVSGSVAFVMNWKNAWKVPTVSVPASTIMPARTPQHTCAKRVTKRMAGLANSVMKSTSALATASSAETAATSAADASSRPKALMTVRPEYASSTTSVRRPSTACLRAASRIVRAVTRRVTASDASAKSRKTPPSAGLHVSIIATEPTSATELDMSCSTPRCSTSETLSRSFVARLMTSPGWCASKYDSGRRPTLAEICRRSPRFRRSAKLAMTSEAMV